jgi:hypothetical protein
MRLKESKATIGSSTASHDSTILITRTSQWANRFRPIDIYLDGLQVGSVKDGKTIQVSVPPGTREFVVKLAWCRSKPLRLRIGAGQEAELVCGSHASGWKLLLTPILIFIPQAYIYLRPIGGDT